MPNQKNKLASNTDEDEKYIKAFQVAAMKYGAKTLADVILEQTSKITLTSTNDEMYTVISSIQTLCNSFPNLTIQEFYEKEKQMV